MRNGHSGLLEHVHYIPEAFEFHAGQYCPWVERREARAQALPTDLHPHVPQESGHQEVTSFTSLGMLA